MNELISQLPYGNDFCFVDKLLEISETHIVGSYFFSKELSFYKAHFPSYPVTPGVILTECAAQIGLACFGLYLTRETEKLPHHQLFVLSESQMDFLKPVYPDSTVYVSGQLVYFRFNKLKVKVEVQFENKAIIAKGILSGMVVNLNNINA